MLGTALTLALAVSVGMPTLVQAAKQTSTKQTAAKGKVRGQAVTAKKVKTTKEQKKTTAAAKKTKTAAAKKEVKKTSPADKQKTTKPKNKEPKKVIKKQPPATTIEDEQTDATDANDSAADYPNYGYETPGTTGDYSSLPSGTTGSEDLGFDQGTTNQLN